ncbi:hypothetical protein [Tenacibaculum sp. M341]|uniref:hypothetical protein n=1 Tax=Tenacibaculum sp. M341 TaxID=2530339 RepID=UPI0010539B8F|nr:hypothetical protein [Tenacibaculum sp. M341]TCI95019.1 hypothetical protein EYW44_01470 [Tenacibaculum sp. M341]
MKKNILIIVLLLQSILTIKGQDRTESSQVFNKVLNEKVQIHYNSNFLVTGETLYYKLYCLNSYTNKISKNSKVAYVEIVDNEDKSILKQKINLRNGQGNSEIFISSKIQSGPYKLIAYTKWMGSKGSFSQSNIFIMNPFFRKIEKIDESNKEIITNRNIDNAFLPVKIDKYNYGKREKVVLEFKDSILKSNLSISVRKKNKYIPNKAIIINKGSINTTKNDDLAELRGSLIKGCLKAKNGEEISNIKLSLSLNSSNNLPLTATTDKQGNFFFNVSELNNESVYLQVLNVKGADYEIKLAKEDVPSFSFGKNLDFKVNDSLIAIMNKQSIYSQIENSYSDVKKDSLIKKPSNFPLLSTEKITYKLDDFKRFKTIKETFTEVVEGARIIGKDKDQKVYVVTNSKFINTKSLVIVDGNIVMDHISFVNLDPKEINSISLINKPFFYGNDIYSGIVFVETFEKNQLLNTNVLKEFKVLKVQPNKKYFFQRYDDDLSEEIDRVPDFRTQLYWNPNIDLSNKKSLNFYTSDVSGDFVIEVEGVTEDGRLISLKKEFKVE